MLLMHEKNRNTRKSAAKTFLNGYIKSGDIYGREGLKHLRERKNYISRLSLNDDRKNLSEDWITIGREIENSMYNYDKKVNLK